MKLSRFGFPLQLVISNRLDLANKASQGVGSLSVLHARPVVQVTV